MNPHSSALTFHFSQVAAGEWTGLAQTLMVSLGCLAAGWVFLVARKLPRFRWHLWMSFLLAIPAAIGGLYVIGVALEMAGGERWKIGYYGRWNRVRAVVERMPEVRIVGQWRHEDVTLEDFGFTIAAATGKTAQVDFLENSPAMAMTNPEAIEALVRAALKDR